MAKFPDDGLQPPLTRPRTHQLENGERASTTSSVPVIQEDLEVGTRVVDTGVVRIRKVSSSRDAVVDEPVVQEDVVVERIPLNRPIDPAAVPDVRQDGDTLIIPVIEETLVVEKRLFLREEVRISRVRREVPTHTRVSLREERVVVERDAEPGQALPDQHEGETS